MTYRDDFMNYLEANWSATPIYALDDLMSFDDLPATGEYPVMLIDFPPPAEQFVSIASENVNGYRERGIIQVAIMNPIGQSSEIARGICEDFRDLVRAKRLGQTVIGTVDPFSSTGQFDGKWQMFNTLVSFYKDSFA